MVWLGAAALNACPEADQMLARLQCRLVGVFDAGRKWTGAKVAGWPVQPTGKVVKEVEQHGATLAIVADKEIASQEYLQELVGAGVKAILNLTETPFQASAGTVVEQADLSSQMLRLLSRLEATQQ
jgi:NADH/NAD ratio-sensing transcriptional regulator Rex